MVVKDSCTPKQLAEFLEKDAARVNQAQKVYFATAEKVASQVGPTVEGLRYVCRIPGDPLGKTHRGVKIGSQGAGRGNGAGWQRVRILGGGGGTVGDSRKLGGGSRGQRNRCSRASQRV